jgi:small conductance mechanosensitive channel
MDRIMNVVITWLEAHGPSIVVGILVFLTGQWFIRIIRKWLHRAMERRELSASLRPFLQSLIITTLQVLLIIVILQILSVRLTIFTAIITSFGVAAGLALSGTLQNFTGGLILLLLKPFKVGDNIIAQSFDGAVESIEVFYTIIRTNDNRSVIIPNSKLSNEVIVNVSRVGSRRLDIELKFSYAHDPENVIATLEKPLGRIDASSRNPRHTSASPAWSPTDTRSRSKSGYRPIGMPLQSFIFSKKCSILSKTQASSFPAWFDGFLFLINLNNGIFTARINYTIWIRLSHISSPSRLKERKESLPC